MHIIVFIGGGLGAVARYTLAGLVGRVAGTGFPWGTLAVNLLGAALIGAVTALFATRFSLPMQAKLFLVTGVLGGFTTFSAFSLEAANLLQRGAYFYFAAYVAASVFGCIALVLLIQKI